MTVPVSRRNWENSLRFSTGNSMNATPTFGQILRGNVYFYLNVLFHKHAIFLKNWFGSKNIFERNIDNTISSFTSPGNNQATERTSTVSLYIKR